MDNCIFCMIVNGDIPSRKIYEDEECIATLDISPASKGHTLIIPKKHADNILDLPEDQIAHLFAVAKKIGKRQMEVLKADGFNIVQNNFPAANQTVMHFHVHVIPRYNGGPRIADWEQQKAEGSVLDDLMNQLKF